MNTELPFVVATGGGCRIENGEVILDFAGGRAVLTLLSCWPIGMPPTHASGVGCKLDLYGEISFHLHGCEVWLGECFALMTALRRLEESFRCSDFKWLPFEMSVKEWGTGDAFRLRLCSEDGKSVWLQLQCASPGWRLWAESPNQYCDDSSQSHVKLELKSELDRSSFHSAAIKLGQIIAALDDHYRAEAP